MKSSFLICFISVTLLLGGCAVSPVYRINGLGADFNQQTKQPKTAVFKFDAFTPSSAVSSGGILFGAIGAMLGSALSSDESESLGILLQYKTMELLEKELGSINPNYQPINLMEGTTVEEVSDRFSSNRLWGMSRLKKKEIQKYFNQYPGVDYGIHIKCLVREMGRDIVVNTNWVMYGKDKKVAGHIETQSVFKRSKGKLPEDAFAKKVLELQNKNTIEFIKLVQSQ